jgi:hypothetical protein
VVDGAILISNRNGSQAFTSGQFGFVPSNNMPPVLVPSNADRKFTPPPAFSMGNANANANATNRSSSAPGTVDCEVR